MNKTNIIASFDFIRGARLKALKKKKRSGEVNTELPNLENGFGSSFKPLSNSCQNDNTLIKLKNNKDIVVTKHNTKKPAML